MELNKLVRPDINIIDGTKAMLGTDKPDVDDALLVGNCTKKNWNGYRHVKGCPLISIEIAEVISGHSLVVD